MNVAPTPYIVIPTEAEGSDIATSAAKKWLSRRIELTVWPMQGDLVPGAARITVRSLRFGRDDEYTRCHIVSHPNDV